MEQLGSNSGQAFEILDQPDHRQRIPATVVEQVSPDPVSFVLRNLVQDEEEAPIGPPEVAWPCNQRKIELVRSCTKSTLSREYTEICPGASNQLKEIERNKMRYPLMAAMLFALSASAFGQNLVVTAKGHAGTPPPEVMRDDVSVEVNKRPARVQNWVPLRGDRANLDLYIVIDDGEDTGLSLQYASLKEFINGQPPTTRVGLAYLQNGSARIAAPLTSDHDNVGKAFRIPLGQPGISASPYIGISDLIKKWPATDSRREILLISSGIDPLEPADPENLYLQKSIEDAQRAGILVHSIYYAEAGRMGRVYWLANWGQNYLSELGEGTGGEAYWQGGAKPVSFDSYLKDLTARLQNQYLITVAADDVKDRLEPVHLSSIRPGISLVTASKIRLRAAD